MGRHNLPEADTSNSAGSTNSYILLVDSDVQSLTFLSMILQRMEYRVSSAPGVGHALALANASTPSLIISELNLKGMSGLELLQHIRLTPRTSTVPFIVMSRELSPELEQQCKEAGAAACLEKPVQANELYLVIHPIIRPDSRRKNMRIHTSLSVIVNKRPLDCVEGECATNLSANGMFLLTRNSYPVNSQVVIEANLYDQIIMAEARIVYCRAPEEGPTGMWGIGLHFLKTSPQAKEIIRRFINDEVSHGIAPGME